MGQNKEDGKGSSGRIGFNLELKKDIDIEKKLGFRQLKISVFIMIYVVIREIYFPSHIIITELIGDLYQSIKNSFTSLLILM